jgi:hypothetical protein
MAKKLVEEEATDENAVVEGNDAPEHDKHGEFGEPGKTPDTEDILNTDGAKALSPNITVSGTKPDGQGGQELLDTVDPDVANAALLPPKPAKAPQNPSQAPEPAGPERLIVGSRLEPDFTRSTPGAFRERVKSGSRRLPTISRSGPAGRSRRATKSS